MERENRVVSHNGPSLMSLQGRAVDRISAAWRAAHRHAFHLKPRLLGIKVVPDIHGVESTRESSEALTMSR